MFYFSFSLLRLLPSQKEKLNSFLSPKIILEVSDLVFPLPRLLLTGAVQLLFQ